MTKDSLLFKKEIVIDLNFDTLRSRLSNYKSVHIEKRKIGSDIIILGFIYDVHSLNSSKVIEGKIYRFDNKCRLIAQLSPYYLILVILFIALLLLLAVMNGGLPILIGLVVYFSLLVFIYLFFQLVFQNNIEKFIKELRSIMKPD